MKRIEKIAFPNINQEDQKFLLFGVSIQIAEGV